MFTTHIVKLQLYDNELPIWRDLNTRATLMREGRQRPAILGSGIMGHLGQRMIFVRVAMAEMVGLAVAQQRTSAMTGVLGQVSVRF
ncbi:hypothetical protein D3Y57_15200 [Sphingomonas paeninsulae]|uniref:Uncharacterized protein n=1 Tax=Sphingomonas paeninsulae TaxID=2319844 RepID=A0A494TC57_SPHPE|nr:hypothetical protein D3Y57_15200 [Sphingomonas paeninsulae]